VKTSPLVGGGWTSGRASQTEFHSRRPDEPPVLALCAPPGSYPGGGESQELGDVGGEQEDEEEPEKAPEESCLTRAAAASFKGGQASLDKVDGGLFFCGNILISHFSSSLTQLTS